MERLPIPDIKEETVFQHSYKRSFHRDDVKRLKPPKLSKRIHHDSNYNRSLSHTHTITSTTAHAISFGVNGELSNDTSEELQLSARYDRSSTATYFEQCFVKLGKIGEGSFGEVFKVRSKENNQLYAVKMSKQMFRSGTNRQERLEEVRRYQQLSGHANCVQFYRAWEQDDRLYMQMELCRENLETYLLRRHLLPENKIWSVLLDLLLAVKSLHDLNLIHLDIKLDNVLISDDDTCKLADFGLVIDVEEANLQANEGDCRYIAPEIMQGRFSKAADIFSLGIAMLELSCCLDLPSNGPLWQKLRSGQLPEDFIKAISGELQTIIKEMMSPNPEARPTVDQLLCHKKLDHLLKNRKRWQLIDSVHQTLRKAPNIVCSKLNFLMHTMVKFVLFCSTMLNGHIKQQQAITSDPPAVNVIHHFPSQQGSTEIVTGTVTETANGQQQQKPNVIVPTITLNPSSEDTEAPVKEAHTLNTAGAGAALTPMTLLFPLETQTPLNCSNNVNGNDNVFASTPLNQHRFRSRKDLSNTSFTTADDWNMSEIRNMEGPKETTALEKISTSPSELSNVEANVRKSQMGSQRQNSTLRGKKLFVEDSDDDSN